MRRRQIFAEAAKKSPPKLTPAEEYERKFGEKPHHRMKLETILKRLSDDTNNSSAVLR